MKFCFSFVDTFSITGVYHKDQTVAAKDIMFPERPDFVLAADIKNTKFYIFELDILMIESYRWHSFFHYVQFQFCQDCGFACAV